jgi:DNA-binding MarR family transcriptional regulator
LLPAQVSQQPVGGRAELQERVTGLLLRFVQQLYGGQAGSWLDLSLTMPQLKILVAVDSLGPTPMSQIAGHLQISDSAATGLIDRLVGNGLARREPDERDRRVVRVASTAAGRQLVLRLSSLDGERLRPLLGRLSTTELQRCARAMESLNLAADAEPQLKA